MSRIVLPFIEDNTPFPSPQSALTSPNGLLCFGGDLSPQRLIAAYERGIFPWFSEGEPILWWSPTPRAIIKPQQFHLSRSLRKHIRRAPLRITVNTAFEQVIIQCASIPRFDSSGDNQGTWITMAMQHAYIRLHDAGFAHSIEVWREDKLIGGLYGVVTSGAFCGESMFHCETNASKVAMMALVSLLKPFKHAFIDCQLPTDHLASLGAESVPREQFLAMLRKTRQQSLPNSLWETRELVLEI